MALCVGFRGAMSFCCNSNENDCYLQINYLTLLTLLDSACGIA